MGNCIQQCHMKNIFLFILFSILFGCKTNIKKFEKINLITKDTTIQNNFNKILDKTQMLIEMKFTKDEFYKYFSLNKRATGFEYEYVVYHLKDTLSNKPITYQVFYDFNINLDTISTFRADYDSAVNLISYDFEKLQAFRLFADHKLKIGRKEAIKIAQKNGIYGEDSHIIFRASIKNVADSVVQAADMNDSNNKNEMFIWEMQKYCEGCNYLIIDAKDGKLIGKGKTTSEH